VQEKFTTLVIIAALIAAGVWVQGLWKEHEVESAVGEILSPGNQHKFRDRTGMEKAILDAAHDVVGDAVKVKVELFNFTPVAESRNVRMDLLPKTGGIREVGSQLHLNALVAEVRWSRLWFGKWRQRFKVYRGALVDPAKLGASYGKPPSDKVWVRDPGILFDALK
jgi:hypothetical protein